MRREPLDAILLERARRSETVEFFERGNVGDVLFEGDRVVGVELADGRLARARMVGADGRHSLVARKVGPRVEHETPPYRALYYRYVSGFTGPTGRAPDAAEFSQSGDELAYIFPSDAGLTCVALSVNLETFRWLRQDFEARYAERVQQIRARRASGRGTARRPTGRLRAGRNWARLPWGPGWALVGDAGMHQDPWSGIGMDMAGVHATFLAEAITDWLGGATAEQTALGAYGERRDAHGLHDYHETVRLAADLRELAG